VIHCAARVHRLHDRSADPLAESRWLNTEGTLNLARQAATYGVRRLVFVSSVKVNGENTKVGTPFRSDDAVAPADAYAISKYEAEIGLFSLARKSEIEIVVVRPPTVYGAGVKANFDTMMRWLVRGIPLPLGSIGNRRSLIGVNNLVDLLILCARSSAAPGGIFLASDGEVMSTSSLLRRTAVALGVPSRLIPVPVSVLKMLARVARRPDYSTRVLESLEVDMSATTARLGWIPRISVDEELAVMAADFLRRTRSGG
jgi:nucleoside-diphosphate-sugar epimerase